LNPYYGEITLNRFEQDKYLKNLEYKDREIEKDGLYKTMLNRQG
jgi:hypothetical protein